MKQLRLVALVLSAVSATLAGTPEGMSGLTTMYARDALSRTLCFGDGEYGFVIQEAEVKNRCSDIAFGSYVAERFSAGIEGSKVGAFSDLGTEADLISKYGVRETVGGGQAFASIQVKEHKIYIGREHPQELADANTLISQTRGSANVPIVVDHIYLLHIADKHEPSAEMFVKFLVVSYVPGELVTLRWQVM